MGVVKVSLDEVMGDDPGAPFWQHMLNHPDYLKFTQDINYILDQSGKHGVPFNGIDSRELDPYTWKFK